MLPPSTSLWDGFFIHIDSVSPVQRICSTKRPLCSYSCELMCSQFAVKLLAQQHYVSATVLYRLTSPLDELVWITSPCKMRELLIPRLWVTAHCCRGLLVYIHRVWSYFTLVIRCIHFYKEASLQYRLRFLMTPSDPLALLNNDLTLWGLQHTAHNSHSVTFYHLLWDKWGIDLAKWTLLSLVMAKWCQHHLLFLSKTIILPLVSLWGLHQACFLHLCSRYATKQTLHYALNEHFILYRVYSSEIYIHNEAKPHAKLHKDMVWNEKPMLTAVNSL